MKYFRAITTCISCFLVILLLSCASINVDAKIPTGYLGHSSKIDSSKVPKTTTHAQCREKLIDAYEYIQSLEHKLEKKEKKRKSINLNAKKNNLKKKSKN